MTSASIAEYLARQPAPDEYGDDEWHWQHIATVFERVLERIAEDLHRGE